jgi:hypothetical protein
MSLKIQPNCHYIDTWRDLCNSHMSPPHKTRNETSSPSTLSSSLSPSLEDPWNDLVKTEPSASTLSSSPSPSLEDAWNDLVKTEPSASTLSRSPPPSLEGAWNDLVETKCNSLDEDYVDSMISHMEASQTWREKWPRLARFISFICDLFSSTNDDLKLTVEPLSTISSDETESIPQLKQPIASFGNTPILFAILHENYIR